MPFFSYFAASGNLDLKKKLKDAVVQYAISYGIVIWVALGALTVLLYFEILTPQKVTCIVLAIYCI